MKTEFAAAALAALLSAAPALAAPKAERAAEGAPARSEGKKAAEPAPTLRQSVMSFFKNLRQALSESAVAGEQKRFRGGSVAAVRGADQYSGLSDPDEPILVGSPRWEKARRDRADDAALAKAVDLILSGKSAAGLKALEDFQSAHPKYHDPAQLERAIAQAKTLAGGAAKP
ncbi:MAG: hypothetical protein KGM24_14865 [Elusimicrobia bacterium]|nr:hypothetical protein [Elusimicrobiota bacterium]